MLRSMLCMCGCFCTGTRLRTLVCVQPASTHTLACRPFTHHYTLWVCTMQACVCALLYKHAPAHLGLYTAYAHTHTLNRDTLYLSVFNQYLHNKKHSVCVSVSVQACASIPWSVYSRHTHFHYVYYAAPCCARIDWVWISRILHVKITTQRSSLDSHILSMSVNAPVSAGHKAVHVNSSLKVFPHKHFLYWSSLADANEPSCLWMSLNRSQYGGCSTKYNTTTGT